MIGFFGALGLPGLSGFIAEMMVFFGAFSSKLPDAKIITVIATLGVVLGAVYILVMIQKIFLGKARERHEHPLAEPSAREWIMLAPLAVMAIWIGVWPRTVMDGIDKPVTDWCAGFADEIAKSTGELPGGGK